MPGPTFEVKKQAGALKGLFHMPKGYTAQPDLDDLQKAEIIGPWEAQVVALIDSIPDDNLREFIIHFQVPPALPADLKTHSLSDTKDDFKAHVLSAIKGYRERVLIPRAQFNPEILNLLRGVVGNFRALDIAPTRQEQGEVKAALLGAMVELEHKLPDTPEAVAYLIYWINESELKPYLHVDGVPTKKSLFTQLNRQVQTYKNTSPRGTSASGSTDEANAASRTEERQASLVEAEVVRDNFQAAADSLALLKVVDLTDDRMIAAAKHAVSLIDDALEEFDEIAARIAGVPKPLEHSEEFADYQAWDAKIDVVWSEATKLKEAIEALLVECKTKLDAVPVAAGSGDDAASAVPDPSTEDVTTATDAGVAAAISERQQVEADLAAKLKEIRTAIDQGFAHYTAYKQAIRGAVGDDTVKKALNDIDLALKDARAKGWEYRKIYNENLLPLVSTTGDIADDKTIGSVIGQIEPDFEKLKSRRGKVEDFLLIFREGETVTADVSARAAASKPAAAPRAGVSGGPAPRPSARPASSTGGRPAPKPSSSPRSSKKGSSHAASSYTLFVKRASGSAFTLTESNTFKWQGDKTHLNYGRDRLYTAELKSKETVTDLIELRSDDGIICRSQSGYNFHLKLDDNDIPSAEVQADEALQIEGETQGQYDRRLMRTMMDMINQVVSTSSELHLWGDERMVAAGKLYAEHLIQMGFPIDLHVEEKDYKQGRNPALDDAAKKFVNKYIAKSHIDQKQAFEKTELYTKSATFSKASAPEKAEGEDSSITMRTH